MKQETIRLVEYISDGVYIDTAEITQDYVTFTGCISGYPVELDSNQTLTVWIESKKVSVALTGGLFCKARKTLEERVKKFLEGCTMTLMQPY